MKTRLIVLLLCLIVALGLCACGNNRNAQTSSKNQTNSKQETETAGTNVSGEDVSDSAKNQPVVIENMGIATTYEKAPESAVALSYSIAEIMVALGLEDKIVAVAPSMYILDQVSEQYRETVGSFPLLKGNYGVPSLETVLATNAEFVYGDSYSFSASSCGMPKDYENAGVKIYATEGTYENKPTFENTYNDIMNLGKIFRMEDRAKELVASLREREAVVKSKVSSLEPVPVFYYDSDTGGGVSMSTIGNAGLQLYMLELAGCKNIFDDADGEFIRVSWEDVIDRDPEYILVCDYYGSGYAEEKIAGLKSNPDTAAMEAVENDRFIIVPGLAMFPSLENTDVVEQIAAAVHP